MFSYVETTPCPVGEVTFQDLERTVTRNGYALWAHPGSPYPGADSLIVELIGLKNSGKTTIAKDYGFTNVLTETYPMLKYFAGRDRLALEVFPYFSMVKGLIEEYPEIKTREYTTELVFQTMHECLEGLEYLYQIPSQPGNSEHKVDNVISNFQTELSRLSTSSYQNSRSLTNEDLEFLEIRLRPLKDQLSDLMWNFMSFRYEHVAGGFQ